MARGTTDGEFSDILNDFNNYISKTSLTSDHLYESIVDLWNWLPAPVREKINDALKWMWQKLQDLWDFIVDFVTNPGWPPALWNAGNDWTSKVGKNASLVSGQATLNYTQVDD